MTSKTKFIISIVAMALLLIGVVISIVCDNMYWCALCGFLTLSTIGVAIKYYPEVKRESDGK